MEENKQYESEYSSQWRVQTSVLGDHLHPGCGVDLHERVGDEDNMHAVEYAGQNTVPQPCLSLEVQHAHHVLTLRVVAGLCQHAAVRQHGCSCHGHSHHRPVLVRCVLYNTRNSYRLTSDQIIQRSSQPDDDNFV